MRPPWAVALAGGGHCAMALRRAFCSRLPRVAYVQGQSAGPHLREYFYFIDHNGQLFLDDAKMKNFTSCFKDKQFLAFFFERLRRNDSGRFEATFPFVSRCGREMNFLRCDDVPIVFTSVFSAPAADARDEPSWLLGYNQAAERLSYRFEPRELFVSGENGRIYHGGPEHGGGVGLVGSQLALRLGGQFVYEDGWGGGGPRYFLWHNRRYELHAAARVAARLSQLRHAAPRAGR